MLISQDAAASIRDAHDVTGRCSRFDGVDLEALVTRVGTPCHVYSASAIRERIHDLHRALSGLDAQICFAVKANPLRAILELMAAAGIGADIVSAGELRRALDAGIDPGRIVFSGVGKTADEMCHALDAEIARFNVESLDELETLQRLAAERTQVANVALRINPDVDARTHAKISTGMSENKFGVNIDVARGCFANQREYPNLRLNGLHVHIGSQILSLQPFREALERVAAFRRELEAAGHVIHSIDVGGGLGVCYREGHDDPPSASDYVETIRHALHDYRGRIVLEPGRWLVAEAGILLSRVIRVKHGDERDFLILDAAMNDLARPSLYDAWHDIVALSSNSRAQVEYDIVGPVCETGDTFARGRMLPECGEGDLVMIRTTGAYAASMASTYNSRPLAAEVLVDRGRWSLVRRRQSHAEMCLGELPALDWQEA
ncbi:MAG TPA: diaminopimelate decarboxylase [Dokdonella sp.]|uniref:diaminopimelate decarboxylase n=1 Tax=Dokdonella sp. TaxID=2291710 RepID=UPI002D7FA3CE|nr:diaminopimelate decarboxylase [Dokdonella sp.]HET9032492.1 diaminopimelate decarboxylase [Dokdonella sp.]